MAPLTLTPSISHSLCTLQQNNTNFYNIAMFCTHDVLPKEYIYTHTQYWAIYKYSPNWHINSICRCSPESTSDSTIVQIDLDLIIRPQPSRTICMIFRPRTRCCQPIWSLLRLFLVFNCRLFLNRIVGSSHRRDIFPIVFIHHRKLRRPHHPSFSVCRI